MMLSCAVRIAQRNALVNDSSVNNVVHGGTLLKMANKKIESKSVHDPISKGLRSEKSLESFFNYCHAHPYLRFWQALRNWNQEVHGDESHIFAGTLDNEFKFRGSDTFYRESDEDNLTYLENEQLPKSHKS